MRTSRVRNIAQNACFGLGGPSLTRTAMQVGVPCMIRYWAKYRSDKKRQRELAYIEPDLSVAMVTRNPRYAYTPPPLSEHALNHTSNHLYGVDPSDRL